MSTMLTNSLGGNLTSGSSWTLALTSHAEENAGTGMKGAYQLYVQRLLSEATRRFDATLLPETAEKAAKMTAGMWSAADGLTQDVYYFLRWPTSQSAANEHVAPQIFIVPSGIQLEWRAGNHEIEIFVDSDGETTSWWTDGSHEMEVAGGPERQPLSLSLIRTLLTIEHRVKEASLARNG